MDNIARCVVTKLLRRLVEEYCPITKATNDISHENLEGARSYDKTIIAGYVILSKVYAFAHVQRHESATDLLRISKDNTPD